MDTLFKVEDGAGRQEEKSKTIEKKDMQRVCVTEEDAGDGVRWSQMIHPGKDFRNEYFFAPFHYHTWPVFYRDKPQIIVGDKILNN